ncbi:MAG: hypothetical protein P4L74_02465 [Candidatus Doudnabacteria bacterium]|nr:hypothetical protein [Candidatus Doudnabacteria bacterium]
MEEYLWDNIIENDEDGEYVPDKAVKSLPKVNVEDCFAITAGTFTRNLLHPRAGGGGKVGITAVIKPSLAANMLISFQVQLGRVNPNILIRYSVDNTNFREQTIRLDTIPTTLGNKPRLVCDCGHAGKLYLRPDCIYFMCFDCCQPIRYGIKEVDKRWKLNAFLYYQNRSDKLHLMQSLIRRPFYMDKTVGLERYTRRAGAFMHLANKWHRSPDLVAQVYKQLG